MYTIAVPVKPFVRKFIAGRYRQDVWQVSRQDRIGKIFYLLLDRMPIIYKKIKLDPAIYRDTLVVNICEEYAERRGLYVSQANIIEFNDAIQLELIEAVAMYAYQVKNRVGLKKYKELYINQKTATMSRIQVIQDPNLFQYLEKREIIYDILKLYDITEDDLPYETLYKAWQRLKLPLLSA